MENDYKQKVNAIAKKEDLVPEDFEFLAVYFEKDIMAVIADVVERRTVLQLAWNAGQYLN